MRSVEIKRILVPTDLSEKSIVALHYARFFAERFSSSLTLLYVDPIMFPAGGEMPLYIKDDPDYIALLETEVRKHGDAVLRGLRYDVEAMLGQPVAMIVREEVDRAADLVIMATHGLRGWRRAILGSVTEGVLRGGSCPVLSVNRNRKVLRATEPVVKKILCPINFTDVARASLEYASQLAAACEAELIVLHVTENDDPMHAVAAGIDIEGWIDPSVRSRSMYREVTLRGGAAERVLDCADDLEVDLIVIGAQHKLFRDETVIGTTTERLVRFAGVPVLSVPRRAEAVEPVHPETLIARAG